MDGTSPLLAQWNALSEAEQARLLRLIDAPGFDALMEDAGEPGEITDGEFAELLDGYQGAELPSGGYGVANDYGDGDYGLAGDDGEFPIDLVAGHAAEEMANSALAVREVARDATRRGDYHLAARAHVLARDAERLLANPGGDGIELAGGGRDSHGRWGHICGHDDGTGGCVPATTMRAARPSPGSAVRPARPRTSAPGTPRSRRVPPAW
jgi:hypothetical protein